MHCVNIFLTTIYLARLEYLHRSPRSKLYAQNREDVFSFAVLSKLVTRRSLSINST